MPADGTMSVPRHRLAAAVLIGSPLLWWSYLSALAYFTFLEPPFTGSRGLVLAMQLRDMLSDERPMTGAALLKYLCFEQPARSEAQLDHSLRAERLLSTMSACIERQHGAMPKSIAVMDQLLAHDFRVLATSNAAALNAFGDFRRDVSYVIALGPDATEARDALEGAVAGKDGLAPSLQGLVQAALATRDSPALTAPSPAPR